MTPDQIEIATSLSNCKLPFGSFDKNFIGDMHHFAKFKPSKDLSEKQNEMLFRLLYKYRNQLPGCYQKHKHNIFCAPKLTAPPAGKKPPTSFAS